MNGSKHIQMNSGGRKQNPIIITGVERSGSTLVARILDIHGVYFGAHDTMYENRSIKYNSEVYVRDNSVSIPFPIFNTVSTNWREEVLNILQNASINQWAYKSPFATQMWKTWDYAFPEARWIIVRRRSADIVNSCVKTAYMHLFKSEENRNLIGASTEEEAWLWWIHRYEEQWVQMISTGLNCKMIWPERMVEGDYSQIYEMIDWLGLEWNNEILSVIDPLLNKNRRK